MDLLRVECPGFEKLDLMVTKCRLEEVNRNNRCFSFDVQRKMFVGTLGNFVWTIVQLLQWCFHCIMPGYKNQDLYSHTVLSADEISPLVAEVAA